MEKSPEDPLLLVKTGEEFRMAPYCLLRYNQGKLKLQAICFGSNWHLRILCGNINKKLPQVHLINCVPTSKLQPNTASRERSSSPIEVFLPTRSLPPSSPVRKTLQIAESLPPHTSPRKVIQLSSKFFATLAAPFQELLPKSLPLENSLQSVLPKSPFNKSPLQYNDLKIRVQEKCSSQKMPSTVNCSEFSESIKSKSASSDSAKQLQIEEWLKHNKNNFTPRKESFTERRRNKVRRCLFGGSDDNSSVTPEPTTFVRYSMKLNGLIPKKLVDIENDDCLGIYERTHPDDDSEGLHRKNTTRYSKRLKLDQAAEVSDRSEFVPSEDNDFTGTLSSVQFIPSDRQSTDDLTDEDYVPASEYSDTSAELNQGTVIKISNKNVNDMKDRTMRKRKSYDLESDIELDENGIEPTKRENKSSQSKQTKSISHPFILPQPALPDGLSRFQPYLPKFDIPFYTKDAVVIAPPAEGGSKTRKYLCPYCKKDVRCLPKHLDSMHKQEILVSRLMSIPKKSEERLQILHAIRLWGTYMYNSDRKYNKGVLRVLRRPSGKEAADGADYSFCPNCHVPVKRHRLHRHYNYCAGKSIKFGGHHILVQSRRLMGNIHKNANSILRTRIFPVLKDDECSRSVRYDNAAIVYGNHLALRFSSSPHHDNMIRANLRILGRVLIIARQLNSCITDLSSLMVPSMRDVVKETILKVAGFSEATGTYVAPASATLACSVLTRTAELWRTDCIRQEDDHLEQQVDRFNYILTKEIIPIINKTVIENRTRQQRRKKIFLPSLEDINLLSDFLVNGYQHHMTVLENTVPFQYSLWKNLGLHIMVYLMLYNRRRPGEVERIHLEDLDSIVTMNSDNPMYMLLNEKERHTADRLQLFLIRGKLNRPVNVLMDNNVKLAIRVFVNKRTEAGVADANPYLFGLPSSDVIGGRYRHLDAGRALKTFSFKCGAKQPKLLRSTILRKDLATRAATFNLTEKSTTDLADHMGHAREVHKSIYRQPTFQRSVIGVANVLERALNFSTRNAPTTPSRRSPDLPTSSILETPSYNHTTTEQSFGSLTSDPQARSVEPVNNKQTRTKTVSSNLSPNKILPGWALKSSTRNAPDLLAPSAMEPLTSSHTPIVQSLESSTSVTPAKLVKPIKNKLSMMKIVSSSILSHNRIPQALIARKRQLTVEEEFTILGYYLKKQRELNRLPTVYDLTDVLRLPELQNVSLPELRIFLENRKKSTSTERRFQSPTKSSAKRIRPQNDTRNVIEHRRWGVAAMEALRTAFSSYLCGNTRLPASAIENAKRQFSVLKDRSVNCIRCAFNNEKNRLKFKSSLEK